MHDDTAEPRVATISEYEQVATCMAAFRDFLGDNEPTDRQLAVGAYHAIANSLAEFIILGQPAHSYIQLRYIWSAWHLAELCWVEDVYVADTQRGKGTGRRLMNFVTDHATQRGCHRLQLDANEDNEPGTKLYTSTGFTNTNNWWNGGRDLYWVKQLIPPNVEPE